MKPLEPRHYKTGANVTVSIRLSESLKEELERLAKQHGRGFSDFVQEGLDQWAYVNSKHLAKKRKQE